MSANVKSTAGHAASGAEQQGREVEQSRAFGALVMVGLIAYGVVHLLVAWIALQLAWTGGGGEASQQGALAQMASSRFGDLLLWITAIGLFALTLWQIFTALWGYSYEKPKKKVFKRLGAAGKAVVYLGIGISAVTTAAGGGQKKSGNSSEKSLTAKLLGVPFGKVLVIAVGIAVLVVAGRLIYRGVTKKFTHDLEGGVRPTVVRLGQIGYCAKGIAFGIVGVLFVVAAVTFNPNKAGGLDTALHTLRDQPFGPVLLTLMALGIAAFGLYCFAWSRHAKRS
ncbi:protein of unknown function [Nakamurella panacisegetis]|uniref:DUF1206 domain-containing protein n=1 Tax=Nakamurella panacisegetis TaxID=1090615 RepID=A0A1H0T959_9ACTN|nr:DUF1206 domain-containing protein [Nakamurella panacisegetis]SDP50567.1 protein of unknown function [Nakamurella panacisegetis]